MRSVFMSKSFIAHILSDVFEIERPSVAEKPSSKSDEQLGERWMNIHEIFRLDVFPSIPSEMYFVETIMVI